MSCSNDCTSDPGWNPGSDPSSNPGSKFRNEARQLVTLTTVQEGMRLPDSRAETPKQLAASKSIVTARVDSIIHTAEYIYGIRQKICRGASETSSLT